MIEVGGREEARATRKGGRLERQEEGMEQDNKEKLKRLNRETRDNNKRDN